MLAKKYKLPVEEFLKNKPEKSFRGEFFGLKISKNNLSYSRYGAVLSKKFSVKAVERNKFKRIVFETVRQRNFFKNPGKDILIYPATAVKNLSRGEIANRLSGELEKVLN